MPTLREVRDRADAVLTQLWHEIQARQAAYYETHGRYWQGKVTHSVTPADGEDVAPDLLWDTPTDLPVDWHAFYSGPIPAIPFSIQINVYQGPHVMEEHPTGWGYEAVVRIMYQGVLYQRIQQHGPETWRTQDWLEVTPT